jgi:CYTH domain-containing protein
MRNLFLTLLILISSKSIAQENYKLEIDGKTTEIELDKNYEIKIDNKIHNIKVTSKDTLIYTDDKISFKYLKNYKIATTELDEGVKQLMLMNADGSGIIIQIYSNMNPQLLNEIMLNEVTKESVTYGFKLERKDYERQLSSKQKIKINKAFLTYKDEVNVYEVATFGTKDEGVLIMTMKMDNETNSEGQKLIDLTWNTFKYN